MGGMRFYPEITEELFESAGYECDDFKLYYRDNGTEYSLVVNSKPPYKVSDPREIWDLKRDGVSFRKRITIANPAVLHGENGIARWYSGIGYCILWKNKKLSLAGHILPVCISEDYMSRITECCFEHTFRPGEIEGSLELRLVPYIKLAARDALRNEAHLMNETGALLGEIESIEFNFDNPYMEFPIDEVNDITKPLWWVEFSNWEDPTTIERFTRDNICLYLNSSYSECPMIDGEIKNLDLLVDILSSVYFLIFNRLEPEAMKAVKTGTGLQPGTICSILHVFIGKCNDEELSFDVPEQLLRTLQVNIRSMLSSGAE